MSCINITQFDGGVRFGVKVVPGSSRTVICGVLDGSLKVKVSAAPEKGKANQSLISFLGKQLGVNKKNITIESGATSPHKIIRIAGVSSDIVNSKLVVRD